MAPINKNIPTIKQFCKSRNHRDPHRHDRTYAEAGLLIPTNLRKHLVRAHEMGVTW